MKVLKNILVILFISVLVVPEAFSATYASPRLEGEALQNQYIQQVIQNLRSDKPLIDGDFQGQPVLGHGLDGQPLKVESTGGDAVTADKILFLKAIDQLNRHRPMGEAHILDEFAERRGPLATHAVAERYLQGDAFEETITGQKLEDPLMSEDGDFQQACNLVCMEHVGNKNRCQANCLVVETYLTDYSFHPMVPGSAMKDAFTCNVECLPDGHVITSFDNPDPLTQQCYQQCKSGVLSENLPSVDQISDILGQGMPTSSPSNNAGTSPSGSSGGGNMCYDACIAREGTHSMCQQACQRMNQGGSGIPSGSSGGGNMCYDACITRGGTHSMCQQACQRMNQGGSGVGSQQQMMDSLNTKSVQDLIGSFLK